MSPLIELIRREIAVRGILPFARFMELALYCPNYGYYQVKRDNPGRRGDFFTSVSVGELFGQLLAVQFSRWLDRLQALNPQPPTLNLVEAGAHDGALAMDILNWMQTWRADLFEQVQYIIIEPSPCRQGWQKEKLKRFESRVQWLSDLGDSRFNGIIFSNELLDAMPVHRYGWDATSKNWFEWGVALEGDKFVWARMANSRHSSPVTRHITSELEAVLPDGYTIENSPAAENWWRRAADVLDCGRLMAIDYGLTADDLFSPSRPGGTLRAYFRHHLADDILSNPGDQDITAHVNFSAIQFVGEAAGLKTELFSTQSQFLTQILGEAMKEKSFGDWTGSRTRQFQTLTHPEHLGRNFRVLVQSRNLPAARS